MNVIRCMVHSPTSVSYLVVTETSVTEVFSMKRARQLAGDDAPVFTYIIQES